MRRCFTTLLLVTLWSLGLARAESVLAAEEPAPAPAAGDVIEDIVVRGQRPERVRELLLDFIVDIGDPSLDRGYARWENRLCVGVYNVPDTQAAQYIADKITLVALEVGLKTGSPGCRPNLSIVFSPDGRELAAKMVQETPLLFRPFGNTSGTTQGEAALEQFQTSDAAVRWWQITMVVDEIGMPAIELIGVPGIPQARGEVSRIKSGVKDALWGNLIIVDVRKLANVKWPQLADYLAMVALAQIAPDSPPSDHDSILNLFNADHKPDGLTPTDLAYLRALYTLNTNIMPFTQRGAFANRMVYELGRIGDGE